MQIYMTSLIKNKQQQQKKKKRKYDTEKLSLQMRSEHYGLEYGIANVKAMHTLP